MKRTPHDTLARSAMKLLCTLLGILLAVMLAGTFAFQLMMNVMSPIHSTADSPIPLTSFSSLDFNKMLSAGSKLLSDRSEQKIIQILLVGQDRREGESQARSDSMILCTFHKESKKITMTSFLRDLYVEIPGYHANRINAAYSLGGITLLADTLEHNFGLTIDGTIEVDFAQFAQIIDLLGGVELELRQDEAELINQETGSELTEGTHTLTGNQALAYSRIRSLDIDGDFSRTSRQRQVIRALVDSYKQTSITKLLPLVQQMLPMITTDLNQGQILLLAMQVLPHLSESEMVSQRIPADGTFQDQTIDGMSVLVADMEATRKLLQETLLQP